MRPHPNAGALPPGSRGGRRPLRILLSSLGLVLLIGVLAITFMVTLGKDLLRDWVAGRVSDQIGRMVAMDAFDLRPLHGELEIRGLRVAPQNSRDPGTDPQLEVKRLQTRIDLGALATLKLRVHDVVIDEPSAVVHLAKDGSTDIDDLRARFAPPAEPGSQKDARHESTSTPSGSAMSGGLDWQVGQIRIRSAAFGLKDGRVGQVFTVDQLSLSTGVLSAQGFRDELELQARVQGSILRARARIAPFSQDPGLAGRIELEALELPRIAPWIPLPPDLRLSSGKLTMGLDLSLDTGRVDAKKLEVEGRIEVFDLRVGPPSSHEVAEADTNGLSLRSARIELARSTPLGGRIDIPSIKVDAPRLGSGRTAQGDLIWPAPSRDDPDQATPDRLPALSIDQIELQDGRVLWRDRIGGRPERLALRKIELKASKIRLPRLDQFEALEGEAGIALHLEDAGDLQAQAQVSPSLIEAQANLRQWSMTRFLPLLMPAGGLQARVSPLDLQTSLAWQRSDDQILIRSTRLQTARVSLQDRDGPLLAVKGLRVPRLEGRWSKGQLDLDVLDLTAQEMQSPPVRTLRNLRLAAKVGGIANPAGRPLAARITLGADQLGEASLDAALTPEPVAVKGHVLLRGLDLTLLQPFAEPYVNLALESGRAWADGQLDLAFGASGQSAATGATPMRIQWRGDVSINDLRASDPATGDPFVRLAAMALPSLRVQWNEPATTPNRIETADIALVDFFARLTLGADGQLNLGRVMTGDAPAGTVVAEQSATGSGKAPVSRPAPTTPTPPAVQGPAGPKPVIRLGTVRIASGQIDFSDQFIKPNYRANLVDLNGAITPLAGDPEGPSDVEIKGKVDGDTPLEISGRVNLFAAEPFLDLRAVAQGFDLPKLSPYSGKWAGYAIEKGKLTANLRYRLEGEKLQAENKVIINQLTFGERVDSPDAFKIPVRLAISLLKDANGVIQLDLPISGTLSDPQFSVGGLILQAIGNLLTRIVTAPFTALAALGSDGSTGTDLSFLPFEPGSSLLAEAEAQRLASLAQALKARPELSLELIGHADPQSDRQALTQRRFEDLMARQRTPLSAADQQSLREKAIASDEDLQELARERAQSTRRILRDTHGLSSERLFLVAPRLSPQEGEKSGRRVSFELK
ncbi:MAG: DUF748 domain-containing protein [Burkholderiaceae bacterium]